MDVIRNSRALKGAILKTVIFSLHPFNVLFLKEVVSWIKSGVTRNVKYFKIIVIT